MSHLRFYRATLSRDPCRAIKSRDFVAGVTWHLGLHHAHAATTHVRVERLLKWFSVKKNVTNAISLIIDMIGVRIVFSPQTVNNSACVVDVQALNVEGRSGMTDTSHATRPAQPAVCATYRHIRISPSPTSSPNKLPTMNKYKTVRNIHRTALGRTVDATISVYAYK